MIIFRREQPSSTYPPTTDTVPISTAALRDVVIATAAPDDGRPILSPQTSFRPKAIY
jgi:hypothetical protein